MIGCRLADHRLAYLEYKGPLSGHRGTVTRCDRGFVEWLHESPDRIEVQLTMGSRHGRLSLIRLDAETCQWQIQFTGDQVPQANGPL
jgi:hypothetical protein